MHVTPPDALSERLAPLLGGLARLIAQGSQLSQDELRTLLTAVKLETDPPAQEELSRWGQLLVAVYMGPTGEMRRATVEALMARGVTEAQAILAVAVVADPTGASSFPADSSRPQRLSTNVTSLDFGTLPVLHQISAEFEVQGGPGEIIVESDRLTVIPRQFGDTSTRVQVTVQSPLPGVLWTSLKLASGEATIELPVLAQFTEAPQTAVHSSASPPPANLPPVRPAPKPMKVPESSANVVTVDTIREHIDRVVCFEGRILESSETSDGRGHVLKFERGPLPSVFKVIILPQVAERWPGGRTALRDLEGSYVSVRGLVRQHHKWGLEILVEHPGQLEPLQA